MGRGGGGGGLRNMLRWPWVTLAETRRGGGGGEREILAVVTQSDLSRSHVSWRGGGERRVWLLRMTAKQR